MVIEVAPSVESHLVSIARERQAEPSAFASDLLARSLNDLEVTRKAQPSADELLEGFKRLAETATAVKNFPDDFFSREVIYADHD